MLVYSDGMDYRWFICPSPMSRSDPYSLFVAGLPGQVEEIILPLHQVAHAVGVAHIGYVDPHPVLDAGDVEQVAAVFWDHAVHHSDVRTQVHQTAGRVGADEAQAAGDDYLFLTKNILHANSPCGKLPPWSNLG
jgi:hypothetical protein